MATMIREELADLYDAADEQEDRLVRRAYEVAVPMLRASPFDDTDASNGPAEVDCDGVWIPVRVYVRNEDMDDNGREAMDWQKVEHERRVRNQDRASAALALGSVLDVQRVLPDVIEHDYAELSSALLRGDIHAIVNLVRKAQERQEVPA